MTSHLREWNDVVYSLLRNSTKNDTSNLRQYQLTDLTNGGVRALIGLGQDDARSPHITPVGDRKEDHRTVSRT